MNAVAIDIIIEDDGWMRDLPDVNALAARCHAAAIRYAPETSGAAALLLTDADTIQSLNARFRGKDAPTNVLSFPAGDDHPPGDDRFLGDIAIALQTCRREAQSEEKALAHHLSHLIVHGLLHLVGYDHHDEDEALGMEHLETKILADIGVPNPYSVD